MTTAEIMKKMIKASDGNHHDINHLMKVWTYAKTIGELEGLDAKTQFILEAAAIIHDIACPYCREKYGEAPGWRQEEESEPLVDTFFADSDLSDAQKARISYLVCHHHTLDNIEGMDHQILVEADYLVNAQECHFSDANIKNFGEKFFRTVSGKDLLAAVFVQ